RAGRNKRMEDWVNCEEIGRGAYGVVHKQFESRTGRYRAVKTIDKSSLPRTLDCVHILICHHFQHELFVQFLGWYEDRNTLYIAMECLENGNLRKHIKEPLPQETTQKITKQLLEGLDVMHQNGIAHGNLKPENIFVVSMSPVWVKLGDFSISKGIQAQDPTIPHLQLLSRVYSAPEVLGLDDTEETSDYTGAVDIWSLGCVIYELLVGAKLFRKEGQIARYFFGGWSFPQDQLKSLSPPISDSGISLIESMISLDPDNRPSVIGALGHAWLTSLTSET
ncbi:kinase-like protein, partial [Choiromyces venosus 120613-1]